MIPGGQLYEERWKINSGVRHDFLLAASVLCLHLRQQESGETVAIDSRMTMQIRNSLRVAHGIWLRSSGFSDEARKAAYAIEIVLAIQHNSDMTQDMNPNHDITSQADMLSTFIDENVFSSRH